MYDSAINSNDTTDTCNNVNESQNIMLRERSQKQRIHTICFHLHEFQEQMQLIYMVKEIKTVAASREEGGLTRKEVKELSRMMEMFLILIWVMVTFTNMHQTAYLRSMHFIYINCISTKHCQH